MKIKLRITLSDVIEVDTKDYGGKTPAAIAKEQQAYFDEGCTDPTEFIGYSQSYTCTVEIVK